MRLKEFGNLNNERFLRDAFDAKCREKLIRWARMRRNTYVVFFAIGIVCIFVSGFLGMTTLSILSLFLATLSLVVVSKYDTQLFFLKIISKKEGSGSG